MNMLKNSASCVSGLVVRSTATDSGIVAGLLVKVSAQDGVLTKVALPAAVTDNIEGIVDDCLSTSRCSVLPLNPDQEIRVLMYGAGSAGDELILTASAYGRLCSRATGSGTYHVKAVALEDFVSGQLARVRPCQGMRVV